MPYPTKRKPEVVEEILHRLSNGEPLAAICRSAEKFPHPTAWLDWIRADESLAIAYARARDVGADAIAEQALEILDAEPERVIDFDSEGNKTTSRIDSAGVAWARNRAEIRLKLLAKWNPGKYGDKQTVDVGNKPGETIKAEVSLVSPELMLELADLAIKTPEGK
jgi:hypothetical protein